MGFGNRGGGRGLAGFEFWVVGVASGLVGSGYLVVSRNLLYCSLSLVLMQLCCTSGWTIKSR